YRPQRIPRVGAVLKADGLAVKRRLAQQPSDEGVCITPSASELPGCRQVVVQHGGVPGHTRGVIAVAHDSNVAKAG
ncbi:hypothetical protein JVW19_24010, partial [Vibrio cholerae O1]|nr:hypothetical protein [Vibrio cholerae O1]